MKSDRTASPVRANTDVFAANDQPNAIRMPRLKPKLASDGLSKNRLVLTLFKEGERQLTHRIALPNVPRVTDIIVTAHNAFTATQRLMRQAFFSHLPRG